MQAPTIHRLPAVRQITGLGRSTIYRLVDAGQFPRPVPLGLRAVGWRADEISAWLDACTAQRDALNAKKSAAALFSPSRKGG